MVYCITCWIKLPKVHSRSCSTVVVKSSHNSNTRTTHKSRYKWLAALISGGMDANVNCRVKMQIFVVQIGIQIKQL